MPKAKLIDKIKFEGVNCSIECPFRHDWVHCSLFGNKVLEYAKDGKKRKRCPECLKQRGVE